MFLKSLTLKGFKSFADNTVTPGSRCITVLSANDLKPLRVRDLRNTAT